MDKDFGYSYAKGFFTGFNATTYDRLVQFTTFGQDYYWKKKILGKMSTKGLTLDLSLRYRNSIFFVKQGKRDYCLWTRLDF